MARKPLDQDLYDSVVAEAKRKFAVWPSAYASGWVVKTYKDRGGRYAGAGRKERTGLTKWFGEHWVDLSRPIREDGEVVGYEPCGRKRSDDPADYPKCRPARAAMRMSKEEVADAVRRKRRAEASAPARGSRARAPKRVATYKNPRTGEYQGEHLPPGPDDGAPMHDVDNMMPDYCAHPDWYFTGAEGRADAEAASIVCATRGRPWATVWVYRAVPPGVTTINPGDWVTQVRDYAVEHLESNLGGAGRILKTRAKAGSLFTEGNSHFEWGWWPDAEREREFERMLRDKRATTRLAAPRENPLTVWRVENEKGEGPYAEGATSGAGPAGSAPERDFPTGSDPDWFKKHRGWRFGYRAKQDAIDWFGPRRLEMLARKGYHLVQKPASIYEPSTTGRQVIYLPEEVALSQKEQVKQLGEQVFEAATREGYERRAAGSMKLWAMAYATEGDPERWPADRGLLRRYMTDLRTYAQPGDTSWRQAWDRFEAGLPAQARRSMKARRR